MEGRGGHWPTQVLADQLILSQPEESDLGKIGLLDRVAQMPFLGMGPVVI